MGSIVRGGAALYAAEADPQCVVRRESRRCRRDVSDDARTIEPTMRLADPAAIDPLPPLVEPETVLDRSSKEHPIPGGVMLDPAGLACVIVEGSMPASKFNLRCLM